MSFVGIIYVLLLATILTLVFNYGFGVRGPWGSMWSFFLILFFSILAAYLWLRPMGPSWRDIYYYPPLGVGVLVALVLAAATPAQTNAKGEKETKINDFTGVTLGIFFWLAIIALVIAVVAGLFQPVE